MSQIEIADLRLERSQKVLRIEKALARTYVRIANEIKNSRNYPKGYEILYQRFNPLVYDNTRAALSVISQISTRYVNEKTKTNPYPTQADITLIKQQTDKAVDSFWRKIRLATINQNTPLGSYVPMGAAISATSFLALSTRSKLLQVYSPNSKALAGADIYSSEEDWSPETEINPLSKRLPKFQWKTSHDERVCLICQGLDNQWWYSDDQTIPIPGELGAEGTHPNCRCIINLIIPSDPQYGYL